MENEYAKFGLPDDPANQPIQPGQAAATDVQRGWFSRNWLWLLPTAFLVLVLPCGCCAGIFWWLIGSLKSAEPYQMALERVRTNPPGDRTTRQTHEEAGWMSDWEFLLPDQQRRHFGQGEFRLQRIRTKGTAGVHAEAVCRNGKWGFRVLEVTPAGTGKAISSLPADKKQGKVEKGWTGLTTDGRATP